jgi:ABC-type phosphate transport system auxiliary subunit
MTITMKAGKKLTEKELDERLAHIETQMVALRDEVCHLQMELDDREMEESEEYLDHIFHSHIPRGLTRNH